MSIVTWLFALAHVFAPGMYGSFPGWGESAEERRDRYESIAEDIASVSSNADDAALLLALAIGESGLVRDVDVGPCYQGGSYRMRCDGGTSATIWQIKPIRWEGESLGYRELFKDRKRAARIALWAARSSLSRCRHLAPEDRLSGYGAGHCEAGIPAVRARWRLYQQIRTWVPRAE